METAFLHLFLLKIIENMGDNSFSFGLQFYIEDQFSAQSNIIEKRMKSLAHSGMSLSSQMQSAFSAFDIAGKIGSTITDTFSKSIDIASQYSDVYGDVMKTTGFTLDETKKLAGELSNLDSRTSLKDLLDISGVAGQFGVAKEQVFGFTEAIDKLAISFEGELSGGAAGTAETFSKLRNVMTDIKSKDIGSDMLKIGNAFNVLASEGNATSEGLSNFSNRIGGIGISLGLNSSQVLGFSSTLEELNISAERGSTALTGTLQKMASSPEKFAKLAGMGVTDFKNLINTDLYGAFKKVAGATQGFNATQLASTLKSLGLNGSGASEVFAKLSNNLDLLDQRTNTASEALSNQASILKEFETKNSTLAGRIAKAGKGIELFYLNLGEAIEPALAPLVNVFAEATKSVALFVKTDFAPLLASWQNTFTSFLPYLSGIWNGLKSFGNEIYTLFSPIVTFLSHEVSMIGQSISRAFGMDKNKSINDMIGSGKSLIDTFLNPLRIALNVARTGFDMLKPVISFLSGTIQGLTSNFDWVASSFQYVKDSLQPLFNLFQQTNTETQGFSIAGQILGKVLSGILTAGFHILGGAIQFVVKIITTLKSMIDSVISGFQQVFSFANALSGGMLSAGLDSFTKSISEGLNLNLGANTDKAKQGNTAIANNQLSSILSTLGSGQSINHNDLQKALQPILSSGNLNSDSQKMLSQIANSKQLKGTNLGVDLNSELAKMANSPFKSDITMPMQAVNPLNSMQGINTLAEQTNQMKGQSNLVMQGFENRTVSNKQAEIQARTQAPAPQSIQVQNSITSTPVNLYLDSTKVGDVVIDYLANKSNN